MVSLSHLRERRVCQSDDGVPFYGTSNWLNSKSQSRRWLSVTDSVNWRAWSQRSRHVIFGENVQTFLQRTYSLLHTYIFTPGRGPSLSCPTTNAFINDFSLSLSGLVKESHSFVPSLWSIKTVSSSRRPLFSPTSPFHPRTVVDPSTIPRSVGTTRNLSRFKKRRPSQGLVRSVLSSPLVAPEREPDEKWGKWRVWFLQRASRPSEPMIRTRAGIIGGGLPKGRTGLSRAERILTGQSRPLGRPRRRLTGSPRR